jgi:hypothetical protein
LIVTHEQGERARDVGCAETIKGTTATVGSLDALFCAIPMERIGAPPRRRRHQHQRDIGNRGGIRTRTVTDRDVSRGGSGQIDAVIAGAVALADSAQAA